MSRECPCCGQLVPGEDEILSPEERESLTKYVDHLIDKAKERKAREGKKLSEAQARIEALEAALRFYADPKTYTGYAYGHEWVTAAEHDRGAKARSALEKQP